LIQLAAVLVHFQKGNLEGAKELFRKASGYLKPYPASYGGVEVSRILVEFERFLAVWSKEPGRPSLAKKFLPRVALQKRGS